MSKLERQGDGNRVELEQMSTAELEELLRRDFHAPEGGARDMDELYRAAQVLAGRELDPAGADRAWEQFQKDYLPFAQARSAHYEDGGAPSSDAAPRRRRALLPRWWRGGLVAALAFLLLSASVAAAAGGPDLWRHLARWTDEDVRMAPEQILHTERDGIRVPEEGKDYADIREALEDCGLARPVAPRWLPEGFEQIELAAITDFPNELLYQAAYRRGEGTLIFFVAVHLPREDGRQDSMGTFQKDEGDPVPYEAGGVTHMLFTNAGRASAVWVNGPAECALSGDITMDELKQIIDSIYEA